jgi:alpha-amylase
LDKKGYNGAGTDVDYTKFNPFNDAQYFHSYCPVTDYNDDTMSQNCWLGDNKVSLPDLNTQSKEVQDLWYDWVGSLVSNYSSKFLSFFLSFSLSFLTPLLQQISPHPETHQYIVDGLRVDTVKHVQKDFWPGYNKAAGVYCVGEILDGDPDYTCPYQEVMDGVLNYPM